jgi:protein TonB
MNIKKSSKASLEDRRSIFLLMGFVAVLAFVYIAFEWTQVEVTIYESVSLEAVVEEEIEIIQTIEALPPPPPPDIPEVIEVLNVVEDDVETAEIIIDSEDDKDKEVVIRAPVTTYTSGAYSEEDTEVVFMVVETMPGFPGGDAALLKYLQDNIKYPVIAQESGIQGRVICQFVVNRDGSIVDVEVVRGVDRSLDAEAIRVVQSMPKWMPGKQRGKAVRVKFTLPINFRLQ